jgi:hypothetical protein
MPGSSARAVEHLLMEILAPVRRPSRSAQVCDCCQLPREATDFDEDACGICLTCLECDDIVVGMEAEEVRRGT